MRIHRGSIKSKAMGYAPVEEEIVVPGGGMDPKESELNKFPIYCIGNYSFVLILIGRNWYCAQAETSV